ncbi:MAG: PrsW family intramembrane metalloprotease, partial [Candidatus Dormibacteraceae bacterium]
VSAVVWNFDHRADTYLPMTRIFYAFVVGGTLGVLGASVLEAYLVPRNGLVSPFVVGLIEEFVKFVALVIVAQRLRRYTTTDGLVLGATVGFGFAALESSGYAFNGLLTQQGLSLPGLVESVILRGVLAPLGHGLWTAVLGAFLFHAAERRNRLRLSWPLLGMYFVVVALHGLWDSASTISVFFVVVLSAQPGQTSLTAGQTVVATILNYVFTLIVGGIGVVVLLLTWNGLIRLPARRFAATYGPPGTPPGWPPPRQPSPQGQWQQAPPPGWSPPPQLGPWQQAPAPGWSPPPPMPSGQSPSPQGPPPQSPPPPPGHGPPPPPQPPYPPR